MEMKDRIALIIKDSKMKKSEFADKINVSPASVSQLCSGVNNPSKQTIALVCEKFNVSAEWLTEGTGPMYKPSRDDEAELIDRFMEDLDSPMRSTIVAIIKTYMAMDQKSKDALMEFAKSFQDNLK